MNFSVSTGPAFNPSDAVFINNIKANHDIIVTNDEVDEKGRFLRFSGSAKS